MCPRMVSRSSWQRASSQYHSQPSGRHGPASAGGCRAFRAAGLFAPAPNPARRAECRRVEVPFRFVALSDRRLLLLLSNRLCSRPGSPAGRQAPSARVPGSTPRRSGSCLSANPPRPGEATTPDQTAARCLRDHFAVRSIHDGRRARTGSWAKNRLRSSATLAPRRSGPRDRPPSP